MRSPGLRRRELRQKLRSLRVAEHITMRQLAERLSLSPSSVMRIEHGTRQVTPEEVAGWADAVRASGEVRLGLVAEAEALMRLAPEGTSRSLLAPKNVQNLLAQLEREASVIRQMQVDVMPGLLQTPAYTERVYRYVRGQNGVPKELRLFMETRRRRQGEVGRGSATVLLVVDWAVLTNSFLGVRDRLDQLHGIRTQLRRPDMEIGVLPQNHKTSIPPFSATLLDDWFVNSDSLLSSVNVLDPPQVHTAHELFEEMASEAEWESSAEKLIDEAIAYCSCL